MNTTTIQYERGRDGSVFKSVLCARRPEDRALHIRTDTMMGHSVAVVTNEVKDHEAFTEYPP